MKKYVIDTNALISFVTDRNLDQQLKIESLFESAAHLKSLILCHQHVLTEFIFVMDRVYEVPKYSIKKMIADLMETPGIEIIQEVDFKLVMIFWPDIIPDFGDAVIASVGKSTKGSLIVTFDRKFSNQIKSLGLSICTFGDE